VSSMARLLVPLPLIPLMIYAAVALVFGPSQVATPGGVWDMVLVGVPLVSGRTFALTAGDALIVLALALLFVSVVRTAASRPGVLATMLGVVVLCVHVIGFLAVGRAATSTFLILTAVCLFDTLAMASLPMAVSRVRAAAG